MYTDPSGYKVEYYWHTGEYMHDGVPVSFEYAMGWYLMNMGNSSSGCGPISTNNHTAGGLPFWSGLTSITIVNKNQVLDLLQYIDDGNYCFGIHPSNYVVIGYQGEWIGTILGDTYSEAVLGWLLGEDTQGQGGNITGFSENDFIKYSVKGTNIWASTIQWGFASARKIQPAVGTWIKGAKIFGRSSNFIGGVSIAYDFSTGNANTSTILDGAVLIAGSVVIGAVGIAATPWVIAGGIAYGISSIFLETPLNNALDLSKKINFVTPKK